MVIVGEWKLCDDGIKRPVVCGKVLAADGPFHVEFFLVDSCADRTVFSAALLLKLRFPTADADPGFGLLGIGGASAFVQVNTVLELTKDDRGPVRVRGEYAAFTDPAATDMSILGRDGLNLFDVIASHRRQEVLLLGGNHQYRVGPV
jgi:hypothetical protein